MNLVIVESPAKAKTINKYLGENYIVLASYGHVRDLPSKNGSVDTDNNFNMISNEPNVIYRSRLLQEVINLRWSEKNKLHWIFGRQK